MCTTESVRRNSEIGICLFLVAFIQTWQSWHFPLPIIRERRSDPPKTTPMSESSSVEQCAPAESE